METTIKIPNREIALAAFDRLRREKRKDAALRLAGCMLRGTYISLGIGDTDWEIDTALHKCGGEPKTGYGHMAHFHFDGETEMKTDNGIREIAHGQVLHAGMGGLQRQSRQLP